MKINILLLALIGYISGFMYGEDAYAGSQFQGLAQIFFSGPIGMVIGIFVGIVFVRALK